MTTTRSSTQDDVVTDHARLGEVSASHIGGKAYRLLELNDCARSSDFRVPRFCILPVVYCEDYHRRRGGVPSIEYLPLPLPNTLPASIVDYFEDFYTQHAGALRYWADSLDPTGRPYLRSSVALDADSPLSFAGVNYSLQPATASDLGRGVARAMAGVYRPYSELYLRRYGLQRQPRPASLILCEPIGRLEMFAVAHVTGGRAYIQCTEFESGDNGRAPFNLSFPLAGRERIWRGYWKHLARGERLRQALADLSAYLKDPGHLEIEFSFDTDGKLYFFQYRPLHPATGANGKEANRTAVSIHHSVGRVQGSLRALLNSARTPETAGRVLADIARSPDAPMWLVRCNAAEKYDAFALLWTLSTAGVSAPGRILLAQSRPREFMHLFTALLEDTAIEFVAQVYTDDVAALADGALVEADSDGLRAALQFVDGDGRRRVEFDGER